MTKPASRKSPDTPKTPRTTAAKRSKSKMEGAVAVAEPEQISDVFENRIEPSDDDIRVRAYFRYLERGGTHGQSMDDWAEARKELSKKK